MATKERAAAMPADWAPTAKHRDRAAREGLDCELEEEKFRAYCEANGSTYVRWDAAFTGWLLRAAEYRRRYAPAPGSQEHTRRKAADAQLPLRRAKARDKGLKPTQEQITDQIEKIRKLREAAGL